MTRLQRSSVSLVTLIVVGVAIWASPGIPARGEDGEPADSLESSAEIRQGPKLLKPGTCGVGRRIADLGFQDLDGQEYKLSDFADNKAVVLALTGTGCPLCLKYAPTLADLQQRYRQRDVAFVFLNPNESESVEQLRDAIAAHGFHGPYVHDKDLEVIGALDARTTTEVFVLDSARTLIYRGAVDDQYGFGYALDAPRRHYLIDALEALLKGTRPEVAATSSPGCELFYEDQVNTVGEIEVTYHNRVSRILQNHCLECHREGGLAPFSLETYQDAKDYAGMIRYVVSQRIMPPWFAAEPEESSTEAHGVFFANDRSLSDDDRSDLLAWIKSGVPEGAPEDAPLPREFPGDWMIGQPDEIVQLPDPIAIKATGRMPYRHVRIEMELTEDRWVQAVEIRPTNRAVVHHVLVFLQDARRGGSIDETTGFFAAYVPGNSYQRYPQGFAKRLPAGANLIFQLHYTPNGIATTDQTELGIVFSDEPPRHVVRNRGIANHRISIPPNADNHAEVAELTVPVDVRALALMPHMHLRGKAFRYDLILPDGRRQCILDVPRYDFNWQLEYRLAEPLDIPRGSQIELTGWYDNSSKNPANPDPAQTVRWGPQTDDEMMLGYVEYYVPTESAEDAATAPSTPARNKVNLAELAFRRADRDKDGKVTPEEFPRERMFKQLDLNSDGVLTLDEVRSAVPRLQRE
jgi:thiol-disulfide isomerase/thioredoxin